MEAIPIRAYGVADILPLSKAEDLFAGHGQKQRHSKTHSVFAYPDGGLAVAHDFGALVFFGVPDAEQKRVLAALHEGAPAEDDYEIHVDAEQPTGAFFEHMVVDKLTPELVDLLATVIGQSVGMEYFEVDVDRILRRIDEFAGEVAERGKSKRSVKELTRFVGEAMQLRNQVIFTLSLLDAPAATWDDETLDRLHRDLRGAFAIEDRYRALDHKLNMIRDSLDLMVDMTRQQHSMMLEWGIAILIALELVLVLVK